MMRKPLIPEPAVCLRISSRAAYTCSDAMHNLHQGLQSSLARIEMESKFISRRSN